MIKSAIEFLLYKYPIIEVTGPRQSGKTTFLRSAFSNLEYVNLENPDNSGKKNCKYSSMGGFREIINIIRTAILRRFSIFDYLCSPKKFINQFCLK